MEPRAKDWSLWSLGLEPRAKDSRRISYSNLTPKHREHADNASIEVVSGRVPKDLQTWLSLFSIPQMRDYVFIRMITRYWSQRQRVEAQSLPQGRSITKFRAPHIKFPFIL